MEANEGTFQTFDRLNLFERRWDPGVDKVKATLVIVHGYAEHSGRYSEVAKRLADCGYTVYAFDLRGHGRSEGARAFVNSFDEYISDLKYFLDRVSRKESMRPIFLFGHSMGGTIAALFAENHKGGIKGLVLSGPYLKIPDDVPTFRLQSVSLLSRVFPRMPVVKRIDAELLSRDPDIVKGYEEDPLVYRKGTRAKEASEIGQAVSRVRRRFEDISIPLLILHGTEDRIAEVKGSRELYNRAGSIDKTLKLYNGYYHEVLNDLGKAEVVEDMIKWLDAHAKIMYT